MSKTTLYVARHGQTEWNKAHIAQGQLNSDLTELGQSQAQRLAKRLADQHFDVCYTSTLGRTIETANFVMARRDIEMHHLDALREINFGTWEGQSWDEIKANEPERLAKMWSDPKNYQPDTGESFEVFINRIKESFEQIIANHTNQNIFIVVHGGVIKALMYLYHHGILNEFWTFEPYAEPTSLSILTVKGDDIRFEQFPEASHIADL